MLPENKHMYIELQKSSHINSTVNSMYPSHHHNRKTPHPPWGFSQYKKLHYLTHAPLSVIERGVCWHLRAEALLKHLLLWNTAALWSSVRVLTPAGRSRSGSALSSLLLCCPAPSSDWPGKARGYRLWKERSGHVILKHLYCSPCNIQKSTNGLRACKAVRTDIDWYLLFTLWTQLLCNRSYRLSPIRVHQ